jgi:hypothetical protein
VDRISVAGAFNNTTASAFTKSLGAGSLDFASPAVASGLAISGGRLYVTANSQHRVVWWDAADSAAGAPTGSVGLTGQPGLSFSRMDGPAAVAVTGGGALLVADSGNRRILYFPTPEAPPKIIAVEVNASRQFRLTFESKPDTVYEIEASETPTGFVKVADVTATAASTTWTDPTALGLRKFFRVVLR